MLNFLYTEKPHNKTNYKDLNRMEVFHTHAHNFMFFIFSLFKTFSLLYTRLTN